MSWQKTAWLVGAIVIAAVLPFFVYPVFLMQAMALAIFACGFNLLLGYSGLLSFGQAALFGAAAYVCGYAAKAWHLPAELAILCGTAASGVLGLLYGILAIRQRGIYLAMITFALSQMIYFICVQAPFTGGEDGLQGILPHSFLRIVDLGQPLNLYYFELGVFVLALLLLWRIIESPFGQVLRAMKGNELRTVSLGYDVEVLKLVCFAMSGAFSGLGGSLQAFALGFASLDNVQWHLNGEVILMTLLGGLGTFFGPVVGAVLVLSIENYLASLGGVVTIVEGVVFATIVMTFRRGLVGELQPRLGRLLQLSTRRVAIEALPVDPVPAVKRPSDVADSRSVA
ncbi:MAG: branched-chain amino acid ABC transporter permease [Xanthobacteraceae bacterium]